MTDQITATVTPAQIAANPTLKAELIDFLNDQQRGGFCYIHGYCNKQGEVANHWFQGACLYGNLIKRSVAMLDDGTVWDSIEQDGLYVARGAWVNVAGTESPSGRKNAKNGFTIFTTIKKTYSYTNEEDLPKMAEAMASLREGLTAPKKVDQGYKAEAKGTYSRDGEADGVLYLRDALTIHKHVTMQGEFKDKATKELTALKDAIKRMLPVNRYRAYKLADNFEYIKVGGLSIIQSAQASAFELSLTDIPTCVEQEVEAVLSETADTMVAEVTAN